MKYINNANISMNPRFIQNKYNSNFSTNESIDNTHNYEKKCTKILIFRLYSKERHVQVKLEL
jgi:hypothetical protein